MFVFIGSVHGRCVSFRIPIKPNVDPGCVNKFHLIDLEVQVHQSNYLSSFQIIKNRRIILKFSIIPKRTILPLTSLKLNIAPENGFLEDYILSFWDGPFFRGHGDMRHVSFRELTKKVIASCLLSRGGSCSAGYPRRWRNLHLISFRGPKDQGVHDGHFQRCRQSSLRYMMWMRYKMSENSAQNQWLT